MKEIKSYELEDIDYGHLCREFSNATKLKDRDSWDGYVSSILSGLNAVKAEIINAYQQTCQKLNRGSGPLGFDHPTDVMWVISIILAMRTIGILKSKASDARRRRENRAAHRLLVDHYLNILQQLSGKKEEYAALFPYQESPN